MTKEIQTRIHHTRVQAAKLVTFIDERYAIERVPDHKFAEVATKALGFLVTPCHIRGMRREMGIDSARAVKSAEIKAAEEKKVEERAEKLAAKMAAKMAEKAAAEAKASKPDTRLDRIEAAMLQLQAIFLDGMAASERRLAQLEARQPAPQSNVNGSLAAH